MNLETNTIRRGSFSTSSNEKKIYIIHENDTWLDPLRESLQARGLPYEEWYVNEGIFNVQEAPPEGIFYNRMSASSHTRGNRYAVELTEPVLAWLSAYGRKVVNDRRAILLETRKIEQYIALNRYGIKTPYTIAAVGKKELVKAARKLDKTPFIVKPNRGGKGTGVVLYNSIAELEANLENYSDFSSLDGINLVQEYIKSKDQKITRVEFIGGKFYYAVNVDTSQGFELCPADPCTADNCPASSAAPMFELAKGYSNPDLISYERFLHAHGMHIAAIEYIEDASGQRYVYDVNVNTNYNSAAEAQAGSKLRGMDRIGEWLGEELNKVREYDAMVESQQAAYKRKLFTA